MQDLCGLRGFFFCLTVKRPSSSTQAKGISVAGQSRRFDSITASFLFKKSNFIKYIEHINTGYWKNQGANVKIF